MKIHFSFIILFLLFSSSSFSQFDKKYRIEEIAAIGLTFNSNEIIKSFSPHHKGILFFYPEVDSVKRKHFDDQLIEIASNERFKGAIVAGYPFIETKNDQGNVHFDNYIVSNVQCIVYCENQVDLNKALTSSGVFLKNTKDMPPNFYLIEINKEALCVKEDRIAFYEKLILDFLDPQYTQGERLIQLQNSQEKMILLIEQQTLMIKKMQEELILLKKEMNGSAEEINISNNKKSSNPKQKIEEVQKKEEVIEIIDPSKKD